jgi:uncharacterized C2H2 Zn-finger protein
MRPGRGVREAGVPSELVVALGRTSGEFKCSECGRVFERSQSLGAHRRQAHGVAGESTRSQSRARATMRAGSTTSRRGAAAVGASRPRAAASVPRTRRSTSSGSQTSGGRASGAGSRNTDGRRTQQDSGVDRNQLLRTLFPSGIPASEEAGSTTAW